MSLISLPPSLDKRFVWIRQLGKGGAASVHHVRSRRDNSEVALKLMDESSAIPDGLARFISEFEWLRLGTSAYVVRVFETNLPRSGTGTPPAGPIWFTMELCRGSWSQMAQTSSYDLEERLHWCLDALEGLCTIHHRGLAHRDLKLGNLLVGYDGRGKLADLGISLRAFGTPDGGTHSAARLTGSTERLGSDFYLAPERYDEHQRARSGPMEPEYWFSSDQYSLAVCLYLILSDTGLRHPYGTPQRARAEPPPDMSPLPGLPNVSSVLARMLSIDPTQRYLNMQEARAQFEYHMRKDLVKAKGFARGLGTLHRLDDSNL